jgi:hypothetical protein
MLGAYLPVTALLDYRTTPKVHEINTIVTYVIPLVFAAYDIAII